MASGKKSEWKGRARKWEAKALYLMLGMMLAATAYFTVKNAVAYVTSIRVEEKQYKWCVVVDAGHGGTDPGKVGINGVLEKDINLQVAKRLENILRAQDIRVVMTRESDSGLNDLDADNKKVQDMKRRIEIIEKENPDLVVSIHQNSYHEENVFGAQVFYYTNSESGKKLAEVLQKQIVQSTRQKKERVEKANSSYYLLKKTSAPIVIVECGFLSNAEEAELMINEDYQERMAWAIHLGIMKYLNEAD